MAALGHVLRLDAAIHKDEKEAASAAEMCNVDGIGGVVMDGKEEGKSKRKRKQRGEGEIEEENDISNAAKLESMGYRELQALARARGLNANGGKKDVLQSCSATWLCMKNGEGANNYTSCSPEASEWEEKGKLSLNVMAARDSRSGEPCSLLPLGVSGRRPASAMWQAPSEPAIRHP
ncbi:hypothetical protein ZWY2020_026609 [Hordeum vulgare]|nr:hypothetical protein ZWY2020_026609 [Hordeum vulgare]